MRLRSALALLVPFIAVACSDSRSPVEAEPQGSVRIEALNTVQTRGNAVMLDFVNDSTVRAGADFCPRGLERRTGDAWASIPSYDIGCFAVYVYVTPGERARLVAPLPMTLEPGVYRSTHDVGFGNGQVVATRHSTPFEVR